jgi:hypothetical protein
VEQDLVISRALVAGEGDIHDFITSSGGPHLTDDHGGIYWGRGAAAQSVKAADPVEASSGVDLKTLTLDTAILFRIIVLG